MSNLRVFAASNGRAAVAVCLLPSGQVLPLKYAPSRIGKWEHRQEYAELLARAEAKAAAATEVQS